MSDTGAKRLRAWLKANDRSHQWLAEQLGTAQSTVSSWTRGAMPSVAHAIKIRRLTGIPVEIWAGEVEAPTSGTSLPAEVEDPRDGTNDR